MEIQCECGKFKAELTKFPANTAGRLRCYCDDCQAYLHHLKRADLLDANGGTEVIPVYPRDFKILQGKELLRCTRLHEQGMFRFSTTCCNTPVANTDLKRPWIGTHRRVFTARDPGQLDGLFGTVRASIMGKFAHGTLPAGVPESFDLKGLRAVAPFLLKGILSGAKRPSPFFENETPVGPVHVLSKDERRIASAAASAVAGNKS